MEKNDEGQKYVILSSLSMGRRVFILDMVCTLSSYGLKLDNDHIYIAHDGIMALIILGFITVGVHVSIVRKIIKDIHSHGKIFSL